MPTPVLADLLGLSTITDNRWGKLAVEPGTTTPPSAHNNLKHE